MFGLKRKPVQPELTLSQSIDQLVVNCTNEVTGTTAAMAFRLRKHPLKAAAFAAQATPALAEFNAVKGRLRSAADRLRDASDEEMNTNDELFEVAEQAADDMGTFLARKVEYLDIAQRNF